MTRPVLAIDPGSTTGLAFVQGGRALAMTLRKASVEQVNETLLGFADLRPVVVIEDQHLQLHGKGKDGEEMVVNWPSIRSLILCRGMWETLARLHGFEVTTVLRQVWQGKMLPRAIDRHEDTKRRAKRAVRSTWTEVGKITSVSPRKAKPRASDKVPSDQADALLIGRWYALYQAKDW